MFTHGVRLGQLDRPISAWPAAVTSVPARAMQLPERCIAAGQPADLVLFRARRYSELLSRPQTDRVRIAPWARASALDVVHVKLARLRLSLPVTFHDVCTWPPF